VTEEKITIYCDGACRNNQIRNNVGAWACLLRYKGKTKEFSGIVQNTTNNQTELLSAITALSKITNKKIPVEVISDSQYVILGVNEWSKKWIENDWVNSKNKLVENKGLWVWLLDLVAQFESITFKKCNGHSNNKDNERVDELCNIAMDDFVMRQHYPEEA
jgi:ribonuclease HI